MTTILYPLTLFVRSDDVESNQNGLATTYSFRGLQDTTNVDIHIVTMTTMPESQAVGVVLHRTDLDTCFYQEYKNYPLNNGWVRHAQYEIV